MQVRGDILRQWREHRLLTQTELAEKAGCSVNTIARIERGDDVVVRIRTLRTLATALDVEPGEIMVKDESQERAS